MDVLSDVQFRDRALYFEDTLVVADLHVGKAASANVELPVGDGTDMVSRLDTLCDVFEPARIVVAGDLLHSFESVPRLVDETLSSLRQTAREHGAEIVVVRGNHDTMLDVVWDGEVTMEYRVGETVVCHGHAPPAEHASRYVIGHDHPTITIEGQNHPCFLVGEGVYEGRDLFMLPAFNRLVTGVTINEMTADEFMSPLVTRVDNLVPVVRDEDDDETLVFPQLGKLREKL